jgi:hypothetical protein
MGRTNGGRRSRVRIDARAARANMRAALHIQHRRPSDRAYRAQNWNKHSLGQWVELMRVGDHECALMCAQKCAYYYTSSIGSQTAGPTVIKLVQTLIETMGISYGGRRYRVRIDSRSTTHTALAPNWLDGLNPKLVQKPIGAMGTSYGVGVRAARAARNRGAAANPREQEARVFRDGLGRSNCRECEVRVCGARCAHIARNAEQNKIVAYSQTDTGARTSDQAQPNFCPTPD